MRCIKPNDHKKPMVSTHASRDLQVDRVTAFLYIFLSGQPYEKKPGRQRLGFISDQDRYFTPLSNQSNQRFKEEYS